MSAFDKVIGYGYVKQELAQIADTLKCREVYVALGVSSPRGLLLYGEPGVGKSLMAQCLIEECGREAFVCRKAEPNGEFVSTIKKTFESAEAAAPSIVYLDDLDKFANDDERHRNSEEYVTVQSCIDKLRGKEVFVLATANETCCLPDSLTRAGRFDRTIEIKAPVGEDASRIIEHYLKNKNLDADLNADVIASIMSGNSCATLETAINEAGLIVGYKRKSSITMEEVVEACLRTVYHVDNDSFSGESINISDSGIDSQIAWHEAGHIVISETLCPGSVVLATARRRSSRRGGFVKDQYPDSMAPLVALRTRLVVTLGGRAASETELGVLDAGSESDLHQAFRMARHLYGDLCFGGFSMYMDHSTSDDQDKRTEIAATAFVEESYLKAKEILCKNREFLEKVAAALAEKDVLLASDISAIRKSCRIVELAI